MPSFPFRLLLPLALAASLSACGEEEPAVTPTPAADTSAADSTPKAPPPPRLAEVRTPYERALRALTSGGSFRFESQATMADGSQQYATGVSSDQNYAFGVRTLPKPGELDGNWVLQAGRFFREGATGYDSYALSPPAVTLLTEALQSLPREESLLAAGEARANCKSWQVDLSKIPALLGSYRKLAACVDEANSRLVRIEGQWLSGETLGAEFSAHGEAVQIPQTGVLDWSQEYPRR